MVKKYIVRLSSDEKTILRDLVNKGEAAAYKRKNAEILLKADISEGKGWTDKKISEAFDVTTKKIENLRKRLVLEGFDRVLKQNNGGGGSNKKMTGEQEAYLLALTCSESPKGYSGWSLRLLADKMVELNYLDSVSHETIRKTLKKMK